MTSSDETRQSAWKNIGIFIFLTATLTALFQLLIQKSVGWIDYYNLGLSWSPGIAAILTCLIIKKDISSLKWKWGNWHWIKEAYTYPIILGALIYIPIWVFGLGGNSFNFDTPNNWSEKAIGEGNISALGTLLGLLVLMTLGTLKFLFTALGEEIGWRGFMVWEFKKVMSFQTMAIVTGLIWAAWHWPGFIIGAETFPYERIIFFTLNAGPLGIVLAYIAIKSESLWPAAIMHAGLNMFLFTIFGGLNKGPEIASGSNTIGIFTAIVSIGLATYYLRRAKKEGL
ncbi:MAG: CPBP family intramembrane glutamic endopeptidase [Sphingomonadales bacterium]|jgi:membrane protease YdiL (CAAX protease family)